MKTQKHKKTNGNKLIKANQHQQLTKNYKHI